MDNNLNTLEKEAPEKETISAKPAVQKISSESSKNKPVVEEVKPAEKVQDPDELIKPLKELLTALEKRQKVIQEMGDYRTILQSLVSGDLLSGEELERAKQVIQSLGKLVKATMDHQKALTTASEVMPALDQILAVKKAS